MRNFIKPILFVLLFFPTQSWSEVGLYFDADGYFVLSGEQDSVVSLQIDSPANQLIPATDSAPFQFLAQNTSSAINYMNRQPLMLDGQVRLSSRWAPESLSEFRPVAFYAESRESSPQRLTVRALTERSPSLTVSLNEDLDFVLSGRNETLQSIDFFSNESLLPASSPGPFASLAENTPQHVAYRAGDTPVTIDGRVTLSAGWAADGNVGDVRYEYVDGEGQRNGSFYLPDTFFPVSHVDATINDNNQLVISATGQQVSTLQFTSRSGSLVPGTSSFPFDTLEQNSENLVRFTQSTGNMQLDGKITLDLGWDPEGTQDVRFAYEGSGNAPNGGYFLSRGNYPAETGERPTTWVSLDEDHKVILHSDQEAVLGLEFMSEDQALVTSETSAPFQLYLENTPQHVALGNLGTGAPVDGSVKTDVGFNPLLGSTTLAANFGVDGDLQMIEVLPADLTICPGCEGLSVDFSGDGQITIGGFETELNQVTARSESGALIALNEVEVRSVFEFLSESEHEILLSARDGKVDAYDPIELPIAWATDESEDIFVSFTTIEGTVIGPFPLAPTSYELVPEPGGLSLLALAAIGALRLRSRQSQRKPRK